MKSPHFSPTALLAALFLVCVAGTACATPVFTDTFKYPAGALAGNGPPAGSPAGQGGWTNVSGSAQVTSTGLAYPGAAQDVAKATIAGSGATIGDDTSAATAQVGGSSGGVVWVGFFINQASGGSNPGGFAVVYVGPGGSGEGIGIGMLDGENIYGIDNNSTTPVERARTSVAVDGKVVFLAVKLDFSAGMEYIFVNPSLTTEPGNAAASASQAMTSTFQAAGINDVSLLAGTDTATFNVGGLRVGTDYADVVPAVAHPAFFTGETSLGSGVYYLTFPNDNYFGYYSFLTDPDYIYHFDLGYEYVFDANDGNSGVYLYDFESQDFFYTSPGFPFPYLYDLGLQSTLYYYPDTTSAGHYTSNPRYFYNFATGQIITK